MSLEDDAFRAELVDWLSEAIRELPASPDRDDWQARREFDSTWQRQLYDSGYAGLGIPEEYGGRPVPLTQQLIFIEQCARAGAPPHGCNLVGVTHAAPTVLAEGTEEQKRRLIPPILRGEEIWCQGFSETEAGSDLAALRCRAELDRDHYVINGHKIWTTHAGVADWCEMLVRTGPEAERHRGITYLALPMDLPGVTVRPIRSLAGEHEFAEVTFDDVRCPTELGIGSENDGWRVAMVTFSHERTTTFVYDLVRALHKAERVAELLPSGEDGAAVGGLRLELGAVTARLDAMWALTRRSVEEAAAGRGGGAEALVGKVYLTEAIRELDRIACDALGPLALAAQDLDGLPGAEFVHDRLFNASFTIAGGTSEIQRNLIAERGLGLPKEPAWSR